MFSPLARFSPSTIRARLALSIAAVLALTLLALGVVIVQVVRATLIDQVEDQLLGAAARPLRRPADGPLRAEDLLPPGPASGPEARVGDGDEDEDDRLPPLLSLPSPQPLPTEDIDPTGRPVALLVYGPDGEVLLDAPSGKRGAPDPPPRLPPAPSPALDALVRRIITVPAVDGSLTYRVLIRKGPRGEYRIIAASLRGVNATIAQLVQALLLGGAAALLAATLASIWLIRRGLAPVSQMIDTASAIAGGDLSRRVRDAEPTSELGRLGTALNEMLVQIERGVQARVENEERLRQFVADAAHELRTPLTSLRGYAELYQQGACQDAEAVDGVMRRISAASSRMARLVDDLLLLARMDHQDRIQLETVDLLALVRDAVADFRVVQPDWPVTLQLDGPATVLGDRVRLHQIVGNLLANARTHTPPGTPVEVSVQVSHGYACLTIADRGPGIPLEDQPRVFDRFWRADPSRVRRTGGTGLGLAIVSSLVQAHDGTVSLTSAPGQGAAFTVRLPLAPGKATQPPAPERPRQAAR
ncbi:MAG: sensor histidine kinase [Chloroflexota bacterium]